MSVMKLTIGEVLQTLTVELWDGFEFETVPVTRSMRPKLKELQADAAQAERDGDDDAAIAKLGEILDLKLKASDGKRTAPSKLLADRWQADDPTATFDHVIGLIQAIGGPT